MIFYTIENLEAFVVQNIGDAISYNNTHMSKNIFKKTPKNESDINYGEVYKDIFEPQEKTRINIEDRFSTNIVIRAGESVEISLPETVGYSWEVDINNKNLIKLERSENINDNRLLEFLALTKGTTTIYLDNIRNEGDHIDVIQNKVLRFNIR